MEMLKNILAVRKRYLNSKHLATGEAAYALATFKHIVGSFLFSLFLCFLIPFAFCVFVIRTCHSRTPLVSFLSILSVLFFFPILFAFCFPPFFSSGQVSKAKLVASIVRLFVFMMLS
jgi:hypothetical protein